MVLAIGRGNGEQGRARGAAVAVPWTAVGGLVVGERGRPSTRHTGLMITVYAFEG